VTNRQTDHASWLVTIGRIYVRCTAMRPKKCKNWHQKVECGIYDNNASQLDIDLPPNQSTMLPINYCVSVTAVNGNKSSAVAEMGDSARAKLAEKYGLLCPFPWGELGPS